jgi:hypothetical protein
VPCPPHQCSSAADEEEQVESRVVQQATHFVQTMHVCLQHLCTCACTVPRARRQLSPCTGSHRLPGARLPPAKGLPWLGGASTPRGHGASCKVNNSVKKSSQATVAHVITCRRAEARNMQAGQAGQYDCCAAHTRCRRQRPHARASWSWTPRSHQCAWWRWWWHLQKEGARHV